MLNFFSWKKRAVATENSGVETCYLNKSFVTDFSTPK